MLRSRTSRSAPSLRTASSRIIAAVAAVGIVLVGSVAVSAPATAATIVNASVDVIADGTGHGTANQCPVTDPDSSAADESATDGIVCTDDSVLFGWNYSVSPDGADDVVISQTLPTGWTWDPLSLTACTGGADYTGVAAVSVDGLTLTCTLTFPNTGQARSGQIPMLAIPQPGVPNASTYTPEIVVTDDGATNGYPSGETVTVRSEPRWNLVKHPVGIDNFTPGQADFGSGLEPAVRVGYYMSLQPIGGNNFKGQDILEPFSVTDVVTGISPDALLEWCDGGWNAPFTCSQPGGAGTDITITAPSGLPSVPAPNTHWISPTAAAVLTIYIDVPASELPIYPGAKTWVNQIVGFDPVSPSGVSNLGDDVENGSEPGADCGDPGNGNDNCARVVGTAPPSGTGPISTSKSLRQTDNSVRVNCGGHWWWCEPMEGTTGTSANNDGRQGNQDGVAYRGDEFGAGLAFNWTPSAAELPENALMCDVWDNSLQEFNPAGFTNNVGMHNWWTSTLEPTMHYTDQVFADDAAREGADCGEYGTVNDGVWYDDWEDVPGGPESITGMRWTSTTSRLFSGLTWVLPMKVSLGAPVGAVVPDFLHLYYDQAVTVENTDGWTFVNRDSYRVNDLQILLDKDTVPAGQLGGVAGQRMNYSLRVDSFLAGVVTEPRELTGAHVVDTLDRCMLEPQLSVASQASWSMAITTPANVGPDGVACTADDVSGAVVTFTPLAPIMSGVPTPAIEYSVLIATLVTNGQSLTNTAVVVVDDGVTLQTEVGRTDAWQIVVAAPGAVRISKVADFPLVEIEPDDLSWTITFSNTLATDLGRTEFIDVLPHNGDGRGTDFDGAFNFDGAEVLLGADVTVEYTTDPVGGIDPDPATNTSSWVDSAAYAGALADVTAIKIIAQDLVRGEIGSVRIHADPADNSEGDVYDNHVAQGRADGLAQPVPATLISEIRVVASSVGDRVWVDTNADGVQDAGEPGIPGVTLSLYDGAGALLDTTVTGTDGVYSFAGYHSGDYRVVVDTTTVPLGYVTTYDLDSGTTAPDSDSAVFPLGFDTDRVDVDFGYVREIGEVTVTKVVEDDGAGAYGEQQTFELQVTCTSPSLEDPSVLVTDAGFPVTITITGSGSEAIDAPVGATCAVEETDDGGATTTRIDPEDGILIDDVAGQFEITVENVFSDGALVILKQLRGSGVASFGAGPFEFDVVCTYDGGTVYDDEVTLTPAAGDSSVQSDEIDGLPLGSSCTITESGDGGADSKPAPVTVIIDDSTEAIVAELTNRFSAGTVEITKVLAGDLGDSRAALDAVFDVQVTCQLEVDSLPDPVITTLHSSIIEISGGETVVVESAEGEPLLLPVGTRCFIAETDAGAATDSTVSHADYVGGAIVTASDDDEPTVLELVATNEFDDAQFTVTKRVVGPGAAGPYSFEVACTFDGDPIALAETDAAFTLSHGESKTIAVPIGSDCSVSEVDVPVAATVTITDTDATSDGGASDGVVLDIEGDDAEIVVTNTFAPVLAGSMQQTGLVLGASPWLAGIAVLIGALMLLFLRTRRTSG